MQPLTDTEIRRALVNASRSEVSSMAVPRDLAALDWENREFLGWRDAKAPLRGYVVVWRDGSPVGVQLRAAESRMSRRTKASCMFCRSSRSADSVSLFTARRVGPAGRNGNTVGTYICADLTCCANIRVTKASGQIQPDPGLSVDERVAGLNSRLAAFIEEVMRTNSGAAV